MTEPTKYGPPLRLANVLGASELRQSRIMVALLFIVVALGLVIAFLITHAISLQRTNTFLSDNRIMYGFPNAEGVFISTKQIPQHHVDGFVSWYVQNYFNFTPESAEANVNEALRLMAPSLRVKKEELLKTVARQSSDQSITQVLAPTTPYETKYEPGQGFIVGFKGKRIRATMNRVYDERMYDVKLLIKPVKPSAHFEWGVVVVDILEQEIGL